MLNFQGVKPFCVFFLFGLLGGWWFRKKEYVLFFIQEIGEDSQIDEHIFQMGCKPPSKFVKTLIVDKQGTKSTD